MKLGTPVFIILLIVFSFLVIGIIVGDFRTNYPEVGNVSTSYEEEYIDYANDINDSFSGVRTSLGKLGEEEGGWKNILTGLMAIPVAAVTTVIVLLESPIYLINIFSDVFSTLGIDSRIVSLGVVAIMTAIIIMLVKFAYKSTTP